MSYRELRNFTEILKLIGYPRIVSIENFRDPNFHLVIDLLKWFIDKLNVNLTVNYKDKNPLERVDLLKDLSRIIQEKVNIKLNLKKLYQADGYSVQELLKLANFFYESTLSSNEFYEEDLNNSEFNFISNQTQILDKINQIKNSRQIASEITLKGAELYDLLSKEAEIRNIRNLILSKPLQLNELEQKLDESIKTAKKNIESINYKIDNVVIDESNLDKKIEQKNQELDRQNKKLEQVQMTRPLYQDEFDKLESELETLYSEYTVKFKSLIYLDDKLEEYDRKERLRILENEKRNRELIEINQKIKDETDLEIFNNLNDIDAKLDKNFKEDSIDRKQTSKIKVFGTTIPEDKDDSFDESFNLDDIIQDNDEDNSDLDSEDELELMNLTNEVIKKSTDTAKSAKAKIVTKKSVNDDSDF